MSISWTTLVDPATVLAAFDDPNMVVVDCRFNLRDPSEGRIAYNRQHIPGAVYAHLDEQLSAPVVPGRTGRHPLPMFRRFVDTVGSMGISNSSQVVAYDDSGGAFASRLWWMLNWVDHQAVAVLDGGWKAWIEGGFPVSDAPSPCNPTFFAGTERSDLVVSADQIMERLSDPEWTMVDARSSIRFTGEEEPIDPIAGHIPGAVSRPFQDNLDTEGHFLSRDLLRKRFAVVDNPSQTVMYCGSGVTAAHNALALKHAGIGMPKLYPGSWSEWITDSSRPTGTGG